MDLPYDPAIPLLRIYPMDTPISTAALLTIANIWKQPKCLSVDEWIKKAVVHLHNGTLLSCKREGNLTFCNSKRMNLESTTLSEISQSEKDKYHMISLMCGI